MQQKIVQKELKDILNHVYYFLQRVVGQKIVENEEVLYNGRALL